MAHKNENVLVEDGQDNNEPYKRFILKTDDERFVRSLCTMINRNPNIVECGYVLGHPAADDLTFEVRTNGVSAQDVIRKGLDDLLAVYKRLDSMSEDEVPYQCKCRSKNNGMNHQK